MKERVERGGCVLVAVWWIVNRVLCEDFIVMDAMLSFCQARVYTCVWTCA